MHGMLLATFTFVGIQIFYNFVIQLSNLLFASNAKMVSYDGLHINKKQVPLV